MSMLRKYRYDESHILSMQEIQVQEDLSYDEEKKEILAREVKQLRNKQVPLVKCSSNTMVEKKLLGSHKQLLEHNIRNSLNQV